MADAETKPEVQSVLVSRGDFWVGVIQKVGFPIAAAMAAGWFVYDSVKYERDMMVPAIEKNTAAVEDSAEAMEDNSEAMKATTKATKENVDTMQDVQQTLDSVQTTLNKIEDRLPESPPQ